MMTVIMMTIFTANPNGRDKSIMLYFNTDFINGVIVVLRREEKNT